MATKPKQAELTTLVQPEFLTLVRSPANRSGFKVIRDDASGAPRVMRTRKQTAQNSDGELLSIEFPDGLTVEEVSVMMVEFGLGDDYELSQSADGKFSAKRKKKCSDNMEEQEVKLGNGLVAHLAKPDETRTRSSMPVVGATLLSMAFPPTFAESEVQNWLSEHGIDAASCEVSQVSGIYVAKRFDAPEGADVRTVTLPNGVHGSVAQTKRSDIPPALAGSVVEQAYGSWGWGHLSFSSALVDPAFTDRSYEAIDTLESVLENVLVYSGLSLEDRKALAANACDQFLAYVNMLIDALPQAVLKAARSDSQSLTSGINNMPSKSSQDTDKPDFVTRSDLESVVSAAVATALSAYHSDQEAAKQRADVEAAAKAAAEADAKSREDLNALLTGLTQRMDALDKTVQDLGGATQVRPQAEDVDPVDAGDSAKHRSDPFAGMLRGLYDTAAA